MPALISGFLLCLALLAAGSAARAEGFLDAVDDMPLMEGLAETGDGGIAFDKPSGRIVRALAEGGVSASEVERFYTETLPQLGWRRRETLELFDDLLIFVREAERLEITTQPQPDRPVTVVRFSIEPL